jgi:pimeloyl-ACP methyl ester carboxylesterase
MSDLKDLSFLFIHGAGGTKSKWRLLQTEINSVTDKYVDLPGRGDCLVENHLTIEEYADYLNKEIKEETIVVGHSMGGLVGIELAAKNNYVRGLVLVASHFHLPVHSKVLAKLKEGSFPEGLFYGSYSKDVSTGLLDQERKEINHVSIERTYSDFKACDEYTKGKETFSRLNIPILGLYGEVDRMLPETASDELMTANKKVTIEMVNNSGHYVMLEQPKTVADSLLQFRNRIKN